MPFSFIKIFSPHPHLFQVLEMSEQENWFCFSEPFLTCRKNRERGGFFFFSLKIFWWNGEKSYKSYRMDWGTVGSRSWHVAVRSKYHRTLVSSSCCLKAVWESPRKFSLFCGFWENLEHKFTKKMDVWITSCKQTQSLYPSVFPAGKKHSFTKLGEVWRPASGLAPPLALQWGGLLGEAGGMKPAAWSVKEGCLKAGGISQHLGPRPGSQRRKEFGQWTQKRREKDLCLLRLSLTIRDSAMNRTGGGTELQYREP